jgi:hypothetical protein
MPHDEAACSRVKNCSPKPLLLLFLGFGAYLAAGMTYHLMCKANAVDEASSLDLLSIDPDKWTPCFYAERTTTQSHYCNFAYSTLASFRMGMSGSASFQSVKKSL